jgi:hypothetical protein
MDYTTLITSEHADKPKFMATVDLTANAIGAIAAVAQSLTTIYDVDTAVGQQLDYIGLWVGCSRRLQVPLNVFFSWNTTDLGWNQGIWKGPNESTTELVNLDDETYRLVMKTVIRANHWDGTLVQYQEIMQAAFPNNQFVAVDNQDMTMSIYVYGPVLSQVMWSVLHTGPLSLIKPAGVGLIFEPDLNFGFAESPSSVGFGQGVFAL